MLFFLIITHTKKEYTHTTNNVPSNFTVKSVFSNKLTTLLFYNEAKLNKVHNTKPTTQPINGKKRKMKTIYRLRTLLAHFI